ncbi:Hypothetical protein, predicted lipoprotein [Metamycoplasma auris 15026]|uniref:Uncharacterized protein n=1 Tax=Metamycoplasma auris 15026 TaxID=1188233 RepID=N9VAY9_9BACT|nr:variable surface lipoprotein [Metamycoplasma auris]ENY68571.1 Hypothetical protein, predicted lipoprotein [Metamycoplasma auris 15026]
MHKKIKILTSLSLSLVSLPLIAASCKKRISEPENNLKDKNNETRNESLESKPNTTPMTNDSDTSGMQADQPSENAEEGKKEAEKPEEKSSESGAGGAGGTYSMPTLSEPILTETEKQQYRDEVQDVLKVRNLVRGIKDKLNKSKTLKEILEEIAEYATKDGIQGLQLQDPSKGESKLEENKDGKGNYKIPLKLGKTYFEVEFK